MIWAVDLMNEVRPLIPSVIPVHLRFIPGSESSHKLPIYRQSTVRLNIPSVTTSHQIYTRDTVSYVYKAWYLNTLKPRQNGCHFSDDVFKGILLNENVLISIKISLKFVPKGPILPACTTATAHTFAFEFDLVMDLMAIFSNKQAQVSTREKTYDTTVYKVWKHVAWSKHAVKSWLYV